ncbi:protein INVOLVED IN DE NOVO 2 [Eutrema salsugineum]|uniref:protein INVOLVED IN DE NOVO 2 n=1 Tax=Eutrema salsugineum TaxID=72664 RepID=UPI000CED4AF0|nr:protein INVOLVED IN DE NOVO 2 [Eutrema salsugineum]XP_024012394.1 protein INVOLVED IN DE NOVO 2 [Eutrema salsugineum]
METEQNQKFPVKDSPAGTSEMKRNASSEEKFVWPWVGLVANVPTEVEKSGRRVGKSGAALRDELIQKGFNPTRVQPIWNFKGHSGFALVEFTKDFKGFENAMKFERSYKSDRHGKRDWENGVHLRDDKLYGWVAREEDYNRSGIVGKEVKKKRDLKSVAQIQEEEERKMSQLVENMSQTIEMKKISKQQLEHKVDENSRVLESLELHNFQLNKTYKEEVEKMQMNVQELYQQILRGHEKSMSDLEKKKEKLEERARQIDRNEAEIEKSRREREMNQKAMWEQNEANKEAMKLAEKHQKEKEKLHEKIMEMEAKLNETQEKELEELELEIEKLKGNTNVMKHMVGSDGDAEFIEKMAKTQMELEAREMDLQDKMMALTQKERVTNDEYQDSRKEMIQFWNGNEELVRGEKIRVKRMGQLNPEPFLPAVKRKHKGSQAKAEMKAMELCSLWEREIGDVNWYPFKVDESDGTPKRVVDKKDEKLLKLKNEYGEEVYNEVVRAKLEIENHNASGSYVILELWNYEQNRKATMEEVTDVMLKIRNELVPKKNKRKRR